MIKRSFRDNIDDRTLPPLEHSSSRYARQNKARPQVQHQHTVKNPGIGFPKLHPARVASYGIHQHIQPSVVRENLLDELLNGGLGRDVDFSSD